MDVLTINFHEKNAPELFLKSFRETGFAVIENHPVSWDLIEKVYREWESFFHDPRRFDYLLDKAKQDGYIHQEQSEVAKGAAYKDLKEFYHLYYPWGRYPSFLSSHTRELFEQTLSMGLILLGWLQKTLPEKIKANFECVLPEMVSKERTLQRVLYYPALSGDETPGAIRAAAHEDINLITLLPAATQPGLQVKDLMGRWHNVQIGPQTMVINAGDMLQELTGKYIMSTTHQVINPEGLEAKSARMSIPTFFHPKAKIRLSDKYPTAESYLNERLRELGLIN
jgi:isopenicillin N synthase-like dioxygenase